MKKIGVFFCVFSVVFMNAQTVAFNGKGDKKFQIGISFQEGATGIAGILDYGLGESFSIGAQSGFLLAADELDGGKAADFIDKFDLKARFNANLGGVIGLPTNIDVYPGLNLGLKNFGGHAGARIFFTKGFGLFGEIQFPISKYNSNDGGNRYLNNQVQFVTGASFDL